VAEQMPDRPTEAHPIAAGLIALVGVGLAVGLILGLVVLAGTRVLGLGGDGESTQATSERSMYLPRPAKTPTPTGPQVTLEPGGKAPGNGGGNGGKDREPSKKASSRKQITLSASATSAGPMEQFDLTGVYPGGEGAILQIQRFQNGGWEDFPVTGSVSNETFSTPVQTSQPGMNRFRVVDTDTGRTSNEVRVRIG
jgi:hypothetical protein